MFDNIKPKVTDIIASPKLSVDEKLNSVCQLLKDSISHYNWVGFYMHRKDEPILDLKSFAGEPTEHTSIPFGKGICGQVAVSGNNFVVPDVKAQDNYIACSITVKSEIVVPIYVNGKNVGQIDIDSHQLDPFTKEDELFLEFVTSEVAKIL